jgi:hypothetical protein
MSVSIYCHKAGLFSCCSFWIVLYRGNINNVIQNLCGKWYYNI